jgi:cytochrome c-type biogenesis protein CcmH
MKAVLFFLLWLSMAASAQDAQPTPDDPLANKRAVVLAEKLRCLVCQNQSIAESNADLAVDLRRQIREQIAQGKNDDDILGFMTARYGDFVLYQPPVKPETYLLWFGPLLLLLAGIFVLVSYLRQRGRHIEARELSSDERRDAQLLLDGREGTRK